MHPAPSKSYVCHLISLGVKSGLVDVCKTRGLSSKKSLCKTSGWSYCQLLIASQNRVVAQWVDIGTRHAQCLGVKILLLGFFSSDFCECAISPRTHSCVLVLVVCSVERSCGRLMNLNLLVYNK